MTLVSQEIPGLYNGVSQQPEAMRLLTQCSVQDNFVGSLVDGLIKRPGSIQLSPLPGTAMNHEVFYHKIERDENEKYILGITKNYDNPVEVFTLGGQRCTVRYGTIDANGTFYENNGVKPYLWANYPRLDFKAVSIADYTIVVNRTYKPSMLPVTDPPPPFEVYIFIKGVQTKIQWWMLANGTQAVYLVPDHPRPTYEIADALVQQLKANPNLIVSKIHSTIYIRHKKGIPFPVTITDGWGERNHSIIINGVAQRFSDLPPKFHGYKRVKIVQDESSDFKDYYVQFVEPVSSMEGTWQETRAYGLQNRFNEYTMPYRVVRMSDGTFVVAPIIWEERLVGDEDSAPTPSFVGRNISNVFFFRNRLGFLAGDNVIMSRAGDFFNFWPKTVLDVLDDDPIDVAISTSSVVTLRHACSFEKNLVLLGDNSQHILSSTGAVLTPKTVVVDPVTTFNASPHSAPASCGSNLYFVSPGSSNSKIREFLIQPDTMTTDAADITAHVPYFLPPGIATIEACPSMDMLFIHYPLINPPSGAGDNRIYVYKFYWKGNEKVQSSWSVWTFNYGIYNIAVFGTKLYLLTNNAMCNLEVIDLENLRQTNVYADQGFERFYIDRAYRSTGVYDASMNRTVFTTNAPIPSWLDGKIHLIAEHGMDMGTSAGQLIKHSEYHVSCPGNYHGWGCYLGFTFRSQYRFTPWVIKDENGKMAMNGRLQHKWTSLRYSDTGYLKVEVTPKDRATQVKEVPAETDNVWGVPRQLLKSGELRVMVNCQAKDAAIDIVSESWLPMKVQKATHEGVFVKRAQTI